MAKMRSSRRAFVPVWNDFYNKNHPPSKKQVFNNKYKQSFPTQMLKEYLQTELANLLLIILLKVSFKKSHKSIKLWL